jgi:hypothetical protein
MRSKVTATAVGVVQEVLVLVDVVVVDLVVVVPPGPLVKVVGQAVLVAVLYVPVAEVELHVAGTLLADVSPQAAGTTELRRMFAVSSAAYDQVRSRADSGDPSDLENCSDREPLDMAYSSYTVVRLWVKE